MFSFFKDYHITGIKWSSVGISSIIVILFIAALVYFFFCDKTKQKKNIKKKPVPNKEYKLRFLNFNKTCNVNFLF